MTQRYGSLMSWTSGHITNLETQTRMGPTQDTHRMKVAGKLPKAKSECF